MATQRKKRTQPTEATSIIAGITRVILVARGQKVLLDVDLALLYGVTTKRLNEQVKRNARRFPPDFMFRLTAQEMASLRRSHFATASGRFRNPRFSPYAFSEHGAIMAAMVLNSELASIVAAIRQLMSSPEPKRRGIGFLADIS